MITIIHRETTIFLDTPFLDKPIYALKLLSLILVNLMNLFCLVLVNASKVTGINRGSVFGDGQKMYDNDDISLITAICLSLFHYDIC